MAARRKIICATALFAAIWLAAIVIGLRAIAAYENTPGTVGATPDVWPAASQIAAATDRPTLVLFAHPHCPCTRASIGELAEVMARLQNRVSAHVIFWKPDTGDSKWEDTALIHTAATIPAVTVSRDVNGRQAQLFGAETSGYTLLFAADGRRLFAGGITASRGHVGDNAGENAIVALVNKHTPQLDRTRVFGCSLIDQPPLSSCLRPGTN